MTLSLNYSTIFEGYPSIVDNLIVWGSHVPSRGGDTLEIENFTAEFVTSGTSAIPPRRPGFSPLLGFMEGVQLIGQFARPALMDHIWPKYAAYTDHYGDYGDRVAYGSQIENIVRKLKESPDTRQAIISLWNGPLDNDPGHSDHPCTLIIGFRYRHDKLNMTVNMRSNDIWRGASSDFIQFAMLHQTVACLANMQPGTYTHQVHSMHVYKSDLENIKAWRKKVETSEPFNYTPYGSASASFGPLAEPGWTYEQTQQECKNILSHANRDATKTRMGTYIANELMRRQRNLEGLAN